MVFNGLEKQFATNLFACEQKLFAFDTLVYTLNFATAHFQSIKLMA